MNDELTSGEVSKLLGISERAVLYAVERGELTAHAIQKGKKRYWRFLQADIDAYRAKLENTSPEAHNS